MKNMVLKDFLKQSMIAAIYVVLVFILRFASFDLIQFRVAEVLMILILFDKKSIIGLTIGCFVANLLGNANIFDVIFGSLATTLAGILMYMTRKHILLSLVWPAVINGLVVGVILTYAYQLAPLYYSIPSVFVGEAVVMFALGLPIYLSLKDNEHFLEFFRS